MGREIYDIINDMAEVLNASQMAKETTVYGMGYQWTGGEKK